EAFFTVTKDSSRPFFVETPGGTVRVTGTRFDVRIDSDSGLQVTVDSGSVQVRPPEGDAAGRETVVSLAPRDQFSRGRRGFSTRTLSVAELDDALAWRRAVIVFAGTPLHDALPSFSRYLHRPITAGKGAGELRVGGRFGLDDPDAFFTALEQ